MSRTRSQILICSVLLTWLCGCGLPPLHSGDPSLPGTAPISNWHSPQPLPASAQLTSDQAAAMTQPRPFPMNEQIALMSQRVASAEEDRKVLTARLQMVETQLEAKEKALALASREIEETTAQIVRTRNELQQWKRELTGLQNRFGNMDREHRETLETIIRTLEQALGSEKTAPPTLPVGPELLPAPKRL